MTDFAHIKQQHFKQSCAQTHHIFTFSESLEMLESTQTPFSFVHVCAHSSITILKIAELEVQSVCMESGIYVVL